MNSPCQRKSIPCGIFILVAFISILTLIISIDPVQSCHRRVEYHTYYKKQPPKGWGWGWKGHEQKGWNGHDQKGWKGHDQKGWKGHDQKGWKGHDQKGWKGHGGHEQKGHKGYEQKGYGHGHDEKGYGHKGHEQKGYGHKGHDEHGHTGHGHSDYGNDGHGGYEASPVGKGMKYKHSTFEMTRYGDKGSNSYNRGPGPYNLPPGYGYSGPYHNTEYSNHVASAINPPQNQRIKVYSPPGSLEAADVATHLRNAKIRQNQRGSSFGSSYLAAPILLDPLPISSPSNGNNQKRRTTDPPRSSSSDLLDDGNFDLNVDFNNDDGSGPFRRSGSENNNEPSGPIRKGKKIKKLSSSFKADDENDAGSLIGINNDQ